MRVRLAQRVSSPVYHKWNIISGGNSGVHDDRTGQPGPPGPSARFENRHAGGGCDDCCVWQQLGSKPQQQIKHRSSRMEHPNEKSEQFQKYLSVSGRSFIIHPDSCMCRPCYQDALKNCSTMNTPWWMKLDPADDRHCPICHMESEATNTPCRTEIHRWAPCDWMLGLNVKLAVILRGNMENRLMPILKKHQKFLTNIGIGWKSMLQQENVFCVNVLMKDLVSGILLFPRGTM